VTTSNIEPLAREMAERICRRQGMAEAEIGGWVERHWECAAAMLEAGAMDEAGEWIDHRNLMRGIAAYKERTSTALAGDQI
jgi:acyl transferase domain-containing protein